MNIPIKLLQSLRLRIQSSKTKYMTITHYDIETEEMMLMALNGGRYLAANKR
jgi:hypothetical protein